MKLSLAVAVLVVISCAVCGASDPPPSVSIGLAEKTPAVDGIASPGEWDKAAAITGFFSIETRAFAKRQTQVRLAYDRERIYVLYKSPVDPGARLKADATHRDGSTWTDDAIELFFNVPGNGVVPDTLYQFVGNSNSVFFDRKRVAGGDFGADWNGKWDYACKVENGFWTAEISILFSELDTTAPGDGAQWRANFCRDWQSPAEYTSWVTSSDFSDVDKMGSVKFVGSGPVVDSKAAIPTPAPLDLTLLPVPSKGICTVTTRINDPALAGRATGARITISKGGSTAAKPYTISKFENGVGKCDVDIASIKPGAYDIKAELLGGRDVLATSSERLTKPDEPWRGTKVGAADKVLKPWTPVVVKRVGNGIRVSVWGRTYTFKDSPFPTSIIAKDQELLAKPVRWIASAGGQPVGLRLTSIKVISVKPTAVALRVIQQSQNLQIETTTRIEYDGMIWSESAIKPKDNRVSLDWLRLSIPMKPDRVRYHQFPAEFFESGTNRLKTGEERKRGLPQMSGFCWFGDEERGLTWFFDRPGQFYNTDPKSALTIANKSGALTTTISFIDHPVTLNKPLELAFGFQATPVKPLPKGWRMWGSSRYLGVNWEIPWTFELVTKYGGGYPEANNPAYYRKYIDALHKLGWKAVPYVGLRWRDRNSPDWLYNRADWELPGGPSNYSEERVFWHGHEVCAQSPSYRDWMAWKIDKFVRANNLDGTYHDLQWPYTCGSSVHGCDGGRISTLGARELSRRVYAVLQNLGKPTIKIDHFSNSLCDPIASFCDTVVTGEEMCSNGTDPAKEEPWRVIDDYFKIPDIRGHLIATGMAGGRGYVPWFLPELKGGQPESTRGLISLLLPMDGAWTQWVGSVDMRVMHTLYRAARDFGLAAEDVRFTGWWSDNLSAKVTSTVPDAKPVISIWSRGKLGFMVAIANHSTTADADCQVSFDLKKLGMNGPVELLDAEAPPVWQVCNGMVTLKVRQKDFRLLRFRPCDGNIAGEAGSADLPECRETELAGTMPASPNTNPIIAEVGKVAGSSYTALAETFTVDKQSWVTAIRVYISEDGKARNYNSTTLQPDELDREFLNPPQVSIVAADANGLPTNKVISPTNRVTFAECRPGESNYRCFYLDRPVPLQPGSYAVVVSKQPDPTNHTLTIGTSQTATPTAARFDGTGWKKLEASGAIGLYGYD